MKLFDADSATISANAVGLPPTASARLIASGTITMVAPTWLITSENSVVSNAMASWITDVHMAVVAPTWRNTSGNSVGSNAMAGWITHTGRPSGRRSMLCPATHAAAPLESIAQPSGIRQAIRKTVFQLIAE